MKLKDQSSSSLQRVAPGGTLLGVHSWRQPTLGSAFPAESGPRPLTKQVIVFLQDHSHFVNCVRFSPDGNRFATASADGQINLYDGKAGEKVYTLGGSKAHDGRIYAMSMNTDKTSKIWDVNVNSVVSVFPMGSTVLDQQLGCLWQKDHLLSVSLSGYINYLDRNNPSKPLRVIKGSASLNWKCTACAPPDCRQEQELTEHQGR
ncbi:WD repeat-containing protein 1 [Saguinus oedipus]|uniref:WD repeat-containing protein 1 n=1 Tax=Saguinus oedipus TaxID=9490 RepID=A0ABQ9UDX7_SAGOE|nr:WD repeat-containing protein 1 [Saguinus oedipus]